MPSMLLFIAFIGMTIVFLSIIAVGGVLFVRPWLQCFLSHAPVSLIDIVAMRLRGAPVQRICEQRIKARSTRIDLSVGKLEKAFRQGADIEKLVDEMCREKRSGRDVRWEHLLEKAIIDIPAADARKRMTRNGGY